MTRKTTIGEDPLDALVSTTGKGAGRKPQEARARPERKPAPVAHRAEEAGRPRGGKERLTVHLPVDVIERARNAVYWTPGLTLAGLAEGAFVEALEKLEKQNKGPFPARGAALKGGRPVR